LSIGRRTIYALLGRGLHAKIRNVPSSSTENLEYIRCPTVSIWARNPGIYIIRYEKIREQLQRATCRQFQCLPERTAAVIIYILIGAEPIDNAGQK
jgi:hypothetical protein